MSFFEVLLTNLIVIIPPFIYLWFKIKIETKMSDQYDIELKKRESFRKILHSHSYLLYKDFEPNSEQRKFLESFSESVINLLLWCSDEVLYEYILYARERSIKSVKVLKRELHFANSIIYFRKELGYKNKGNIISPRDIVKIFRIGFKKHL